MLEHLHLDVLDESLREGDYDGVLHVYTLYLRLKPRSIFSIISGHRFSYWLPRPHIDLYALRGARSVHIVKLLLSLDTLLTPRDVAEMLMHYTVSGRVNLVLFVCRTMSIPKNALDVLVHELDCAIYEFDFDDPEDVDPMETYRPGYERLPFDKMHGFSASKLWRDVFGYYEIEHFNLTGVPMCGLTSVQQSVYLEIFHLLEYCQKYGMIPDDFV